ncbi:MAG TPA: hypothetical protein DCS63_09075 [Elusimicrobia bacterium]|nr:hypothetical protein [Elusimicrobiota bacterium]
MEESFSQKKFTGLIQRTLLAGVFLSAFLLFLGFAFAVSGAPYGQELLRAGILALLLTPAARVVMLIYGYWRGGEFYFALASFVVLALLAVSALV